MTSYSNGISDSFITRSDAALSKQTSFSMDDTCCIKKWCISNGTILLIFQQNSKYFAKMIVEGKISIVLKNKISNIPTSVQQNKKLLQQYLENTFPIIHKCGDTYTISVNHRLLGGMFSPKNWGHAWASITGKTPVYQAGSFMGHSQVHVAATQGWVEDLKKFVEAGDDINMVNSKGNTPLDDAIRERNTACEQYLRDHGAKRSNEL